jgi:hypothetical protein
MEEDQLHLVFQEGHYAQMGRSEEFEGRKVYLLSQFQSIE